MANQNGAMTPGAKDKGARSAGTRRPGEGSRVRPSGATSERDDTYGLISVIYHSLQGAETCARYESDARRSKNDELAAFFEECRAELNARALRGRRLLAACIEGLDDDDDAGSSRLIGGLESD